MRKNINFLSALVLGFAAIACSSPEKMAEMAENGLVSKPHPLSGQQRTAQNQHGLRKNSERQRWE